MKLYSENKYYKLYEGNMLDLLEVIDKENIDVILTDPPYELNFMGKGWDNAGISFQPDTWKKCYEVLKEGGYLLAFGGSRTFHRIACAIEDAGFEIRDTIMWLYGSGFPKSQNISKILDKKFGEERPIIGYTTNAGIAKNAKPDNTGSHIWSGNIRSDEPITNLAKQWQGWGTCLKPSFEPIIVARKPFKGSLVDNVIENGVGGINIDECRVGNEERTQFSDRSQSKSTVYNSYKQDNAHYETVQGRFPANTILTYDETDFDEVCGGFPDTKGGTRHNTAIRKSDKNSGYGFDVNTRNEFNDSGSASRYFMNCKYTRKDEETRRYIYTPKASKKDRDEGCDILNDGLLRRMRPDKDDSNPTGLNKEGRFAPVVRKNIHPTVKPTTLMQYLVRLVTPNGGTVLDPFNGSGSTGKAVMYENKERNKDYKYIGIELTEEYLPISKARIEYVSNQIQEENKWSDLD